MTDTIPNGRVTGLTRRLAAAVGTVQSPFSGHVQAHDWGGRWWEWEVDFTITQGQDGRELDALINAQGGASTVSIFRDPTAGRAEIMDAITTATAVTAAGATRVETSGWTAGTTTPPQLGDFFSTGAFSSLRLYQITGAPVGVGTTGFRFDVSPPVREQLPGSTALNFNTPGCAVRLVNPPSTRILAAERYRFSLTLVEAL